MICILTTPAKLWSHVPIAMIFVFSLFDCQFVVTEALVD